MIHLAAPSPTPSLDFAVPARHRPARSFYPKRLNLAQTISRITSHIALAAALLVTSMVTVVSSAEAAEFCTAAFAADGGQNSDADLATRTLRVRADGGFGTEHTSDAEVGFEFEAVSSINADLELGLTYNGQLVGELGTNLIYGDIDVRVVLRDVTDGSEIDTVVLLDKRQDGSGFKKVYEVVTSNPFDAPIATFDNVPLETGHTYTVTVRALAKAKGLAGEADFKDGERSIDVGCLQITEGEGLDSDGDGLYDHWEQDGIDVDFDGVIDLDLPAFGAQWDHKDLFVELDWRTGEEPSRAEINAWKAAFAQAPVDAGGVSNPSTLPGINLWVDTGGLMEDGMLVGDDFGGGNEITEAVRCLDASFYDAKALYFDPIRLLAFRYMVSGISPGENECADGSKPGGLAERPGNDAIVYSTDPAYLVHELGHNLNLRHGGGDGINNKPNYVSIMNYNYGLDIPQNGGGPGLVDFSPPRCLGCPTGRGTVPDDLDERSLDETKVLDMDDDRNMFIFRDLLAVDKPWPMSGLDTDGDVALDVDWDGDGVISGGTVTVDINEDGKCVAPGTDGTMDTVPSVDDVLLSDNIIHDGPNRRCDSTAVDDDQQIRDPGAEQPDILVGHDDWAAIQLNPRAFGEDSESALNLSDEPERSLEETLAVARAIHETDLEITKSAPSRVNVGKKFTYTLTVHNLGPRPAQRIRVTDTLPPEVTLLEGPRECFESGDRDLICEPSPLFPGESHKLRIEVMVDPAAVAALPAPVMIKNTAKVENRVPLGLNGQFGFASDDPDFSNNIDTVSTEVNRSPVADPGVAYVAECQGSQSIVQLDGSASFDPDGNPLSFQWSTSCPGGVFNNPNDKDPRLTLTSAAPFPLVCGVSLEVTDPDALADTVGTSVTVDDTMPPVLQVQLSPNLLWPPDHTLRGITATVTATDTCDPSPSVVLTTVFSDEPDDAPGNADGDTTGDIDGVDLGTEDLSFNLRAERDTTGAGRTYTAAYMATDAQGLISSTAEQVTVPIEN